MVKYCFGSKDGLLDALLDRALRQLAGELERLSAADLAPEAKLRRHVGEIVAQLRPLPLRQPADERAPALGRPRTRSTASARASHGRLATSTRRCSPRAAPPGLARPRPDAVLLLVVGAVRVPFSARPLLERAFDEELDSDLVERYKRPGRRPRGRRREQLTRAVGRGSCEPVTPALIVGASSSPPSATRSRTGSRRSPSIAPTRSMRSTPPWSASWSACGISSTPTTPCGRRRHRPAAARSARGYDLSGGDGFDVLARARERGTEEVRDGDIPRDSGGLIALRHVPLHEAADRRDQRRRRRLRRHVPAADGRARRLTSWPRR